MGLLNHELTYALVEFASVPRSRLVFIDVPQRASIDRLSQVNSFNEEAYRSFRDDCFPYGLRR